MIVRDTNGQRWELSDDNVRVAAILGRTRIWARGSIAAEIEISEETLAEIIQEHEKKRKEFLRSVAAANAATLED